MFADSGNDVTVIVLEKKLYQTFEEMLTTEGLDKCLPGVKAIQEGVLVYRQFYSEEEERELGALAFKVDSYCSVLGQARDSKGHFYTDFMVR